MRTDQLYRDILTPYASLRSAFKVCDLECAVLIPKLSITNVAVLASNRYRDRLGLNLNSSDSNVCKWKIVIVGAGNIGFERTIAVREL